MSNHLAIATVTAVLRQTLEDAVRLDVGGASVEILPPNDNKLKDNEPRLNLYLFRMSPNAAWRNADLPMRRDDGSLGTRSLLALDLHYMLTAYGRATANDPEAHRVLGSAVRALHDKPMLTRAEIRAAVGAMGSLAGSDLADQVETIRIAPLSLTLDELSKLWMFFQAPYRISVAYEAAVVLIDGKRSPRGALPVRARTVYVEGLRRPSILAVAAAAGPGTPVVSGEEIVIEGRDLRGDVTRIRIGGIDVVPAPEAISDERVAVSVPATVRAGVQGVQVLHPRMMGTPATEHTGVESNVAALVLHPLIRRSSPGGPFVISVSVSSGAGSSPRSGQITVGVSPSVEREQRVTLLLNEFNPPADRPVRGFSFAAPSRATSPDETTDSITIPFRRVPAGSYLVRVQVEGAESPLETGAGGAYSEPRVTIP